jgi:hypothetical protein
VFLRLIGCIDQCYDFLNRPQPNPTVDDCYQASCTCLMGSHAMAVVDDELRVHGLVIEMSQSSWLVAGMLPGIERQPHKKLEPSPERLLGLLHRWQDEAVRAGRTITRI